jgi:hypothetical protein
MNQHEFLRDAHREVLRELLHSVPDHDPGDEHADPPPEPAVEPSVLSVMIDRFLLENPECEFRGSEFVWDLMGYADGMRSCCRACALQYCGEDGS